MTNAVKSDIARRWTAQEMADLVNLSSSRLAHLFAEEVGKGPRHFLVECRLLEAQRLLETSFLCVKEICNSVGFRDRSYFNRAFKKRFGTAPGQGRRLHSTRLSTASVKE